MTGSQSNLRAGFARWNTRPMRIMLVLGFSSGLPISLVFSTLTVWLSEAKIDRATIGQLSWIGLAYSFKWVWSPLVDALKWPILHRLGRLRSWLLASQGLVILGLLGMGFCRPEMQLSGLVVAAIFTAFASATQDIAVDACRIELGRDDNVDLLSAAYMMGYRIALILASAGALTLAEVFTLRGFANTVSWQWTYVTMSVLMVPGLLVSLWMNEPNPNHDQQRLQRIGISNVASASRWSEYMAYLHDGVVAPLGDFFARYRSSAILILLVIATYKISDIVLGSVMNTFLVELGFKKSEIASMVNLTGLVMTVVGTMMGGWLMARKGSYFTLFVGGLLASLSNLSYAWLSSAGHDMQVLAVVVVIDNISAGIASAAFVAYLSRLVNVGFSASQYAILSSLMTLLPRFLGGYSGQVVNSHGWTQFFLISALLGVPVLLILYLSERSINKAE